MATTAKGTPYVESSDLVANYPAVSLALAEHIDDLGKILQVVRATDTTQRTTTSTSFVDVTGMSVTITPQKSTSAIIVWALGTVRSTASVDAQKATFQITDSSNNPISGAQSNGVIDITYTGAGTRVAGVNMSIVGYATPATTSATTYKLRFLASASGTNALRGDTVTSQLYAIEVSA